VLSIWLLLVVAGVGEVVVVVVVLVVIGHPLLAKTLAAGQVLKVH
jgi:hypothetical protein